MKLFQEYDFHNDLKTFHLLCINNLKSILSNILKFIAAKLTTILQTMMVSQNTLSQNGNYPVIDMKGTLTIDKDKNLGKK